MLSASLNKTFRSFLLNLVVIIMHNIVISGFFIISVLILVANGDTDTKWMKDTLQSHFSQPRHHVTYPKYKNRAMSFIRDQFREFGLETHLHKFNTRLNKVSLGGNVNYKICN